MSPLELKPTPKPIQNYDAALRQLDDPALSHEGAIKSAFHGRLDPCARQHEWALVPEWEIRRPRPHPLRVDGVRHSLSASIGEKVRVRCRSEVSDFSQKSVKVVKALPPWPANREFSVSWIET